jgi:hypothetical protein
MGQFSVEIWPEVGQFLMKLNSCEFASNSDPLRGGFRVQK